jgi:5-methylcytosine-specific restriction endonuclease McrA
MPLDKFKRYQSGYTWEEHLPLPPKGFCRCGCGNPLPPRKRMWFSEEHQYKSLMEYQTVKGDFAVIRMRLAQRDLCKCANCGNIDSQWQADHIIEVANGGGGCDLDNFQTLCLECHKKKTGNFATERAKRKG